MAQVLHLSHKQQPRQGGLNQRQLSLLYESAKRRLDLSRDHSAEFLRQLREINADLVQYKHRPFRRCRSSRRVGSGRPKFYSSWFCRS